MSSGPDLHERRLVQLRGTDRAAKSAHDLLAPRCPWALKFVGALLGAPQHDVPGWPLLLVDEGEKPLKPAGLLHRRNDLFADRRHHLVASRGIEALDLD